MTASISDRVTLVEILERTRPYEEFTTALEAATTRLEAEGIQTLVALQFYADPESTEVGGVLTFADHRHFMEHVHMITAWPEFKHLLSTVKPIDVKVYGRLSAEAREWLGNINVLSKTFEHPVAGFVR